MGTERQVTDKVHLLLVDDEALMAPAEVSRLGAARYSVCHVTSGEEVVCLIRTREADAAANRGDNRGCPRV